MQADKAANRDLLETRVRRPGFAGLLLAWAACMLLAGCAKAPAEQRLRERIAAMEAAVEQRDTDAFMEGIAVNFVGEQGVDRQGLRRVLALQMLRNAEISAVLGPLEIALTDDQARVGFEVLVTGGAGGLLPERGQSVRVDSGWRDSDDGWQVVTADWSKRF